MAGEQLWLGSKNAENQLWGLTVPGLALLALSAAPHHFRPVFPSPSPWSFRSLIITQSLNLVHASALFWWGLIIENFKMNYLYTDELSHAALSFIIYAYLLSLLISGDPLMLLGALGCSFSSQEPVPSLACVLATHSHIQCHAINFCVSPGKWFPHQFIFCSEWVQVKESLFSSSIMLRALCWGAGHSKKCIINTPWKFLLHFFFFFYFLKLPSWNCTPTLLTPHHLSRCLYIRKEQLLSFITAGLAAAPAWKGTGWPGAEPARSLLLRDVPSSPCNTPESLTWVFWKTKIASEF